MTDAPSAATADSAADERPTVEINRRLVYIIYAALMAAMFLSSMDQSVVSTALPTIVGDLGAVAHEGWIITSYLLAIAIVMPIYGKIGDLYGRRWPFLFAITIFVIGSLASALAGSFWILVAARTFQGLGAGGLVILSQAIIADIVSARDRGKYMGPMGAIFGVASVAGPLLGGYFTEGPGWRWCFWLNVPIGLTALVVAFFALKLPMQKSTRPFDWWGTILLTLFTSGIVFLTSWTSVAPSGKYDWSNPWLGALLVATIVAFGLFILVETRVDEPLVPLRLFRSSVFTVSVLVALILGITMFAALSYLPTFLQMARGAGPTDSGLLMLPMTAGVMLTAVVSGLLITKTGKYRIYPIMGMAITTAGIAWLTRLTGSMSMILFGAMIFVLGFGMGLVIQTIVIAVQNAVDPSEVGTATSTNNFLREIGAAVGTSIFGTLFTSRLTTNLHDVMDKIPPEDLPKGLLDGDLTPTVVKNLPEPLHTQVVDAYVNAMAPTFWFLVPIAAIGFILSLFLRNKALSTQAGLVAKGQVDEPDAPFKDAAPAPVS
ncbi:MFS transporter [Gordonia alkaliphila]|uniref:MDR family MFS transporter n=1 Tax=Gordonia alkaliphila TaxID=1053547 RepID=UPI001FF39984|nr:MDR family MFS transporter [Gordonia alkaliphila]MCK0439293.1 MFS transporter [Gordonia alkaliphila]